MAAFPTPPAEPITFRLEVDVALSTFPCAGHAGHKCQAIITPGEVMYCLSPIKKDGSGHESFAFSLCSRCGQDATSDMRAAVKGWLLMNAPKPASPTP